MKEIACHLRLSVMIATLACVMAMAIPAHAEGWLYDAELGAAAGLEGNDVGTGLEWQRARLRLFGGFEMRDDEEDYAGYGFRMFSEIERRSSLGGEVFYTRYVDDFGLFGGLTAVVFPKSLLGVKMGVRYTIPLGESFGVLLEPSFSAMPLGGDLPKRGVLLWGLLAVGLKLGL